MTISRASALLAVAAAVTAAVTVAPGVAGISGGPAYGSTARDNPASPAGSARSGTPLPAPEPAWFTQALDRQVREASRLGAAVPLPDDADVPTGALLFRGIRPGTRMIAPSGCTLNYVFGAGDKLSIGTAGHCTKVGQDVTVVSAPGVLLNIGTTIRSVADGVGDDFALVRIRPQLRRFVIPAISYVGGPTGPATPEPGDAILYVGHGSLLGYGGTPRPGVVSYRTGTGFGWVGVAALGDSGSPVRLLDGRAAGALTHLVADQAAMPTTVAGTTIERMQQIAGLPVTPAGVLPQPDLPIPLTR